MKIIAELCQNHNGDYEILSHMIEEAAKNGASHVKIQNIFTKNLTYRPQFENGLIENDKIISIKRPFQTEYERLKKLELDYSAVSRFISRCKDFSVVPMTTCFTRGDINDLTNIGFKEIKIASYDCASFKLIKDLSKNFACIYLSTGASYDEEIELASKILTRSGVDFYFLHCVTKYPTKLVDFNLNKMIWLKKYSEKIGLSDHSHVKTDGIIASKIAIFLGANVIERHFTILDEDKTKDGPVSITPKLLREIQDFSKLSHSDQELNIKENLPDWENILLGNENRELSHEELLNRDYYRGRFATPREKNNHNSSSMIFNWEEIEI